MGSCATELLDEFLELPVFLTINENEFDKRIRLLQNRSDGAFDFPRFALHRHEHTDHAVCTRRPAGEKPISARQSEPSFKKNEKRCEGSKPAHEEKGELK